MKAVRIAALGLVAAVGLLLLTDGTPTRATDWCAGGVCQEWLARYDGPVNGTDQASALAVDGAGNVYVTGSSEAIGTGYDYLTIKYAATGNKEWEARYNGPASGTDDAWAIALDGAGNVYVTGQSQGIATGYDYATVKYLSDGTEDWVARYDEAGGSDQPFAIAVDGGYVYVTGESEGVGTGPDYATIKYDASNGSEVWMAPARYDGPASGFDAAIAIVVDGGYVYVTGESEGVGTSSDYATIKYNASNGSEVWMAPARYDEAAGHDEAYAIAVDGGYVYVTGSSEGSMTGQDYATIKYDATNGSEVWLAPARYDGPASGFDAANAIAVDGGYVYVTGESEGVGTSSDYATIKYDASDGSEVWLAPARYDGPASGLDTPYAIGVGGTGQTNLTNNPAWDEMPAWSPDGSQIAFVSDRDGDGEIYVMNADGTGQTNLTNNPAMDEMPAWSPDGFHIAFVSDRDGDGEIYVMNADGAAKVYVTGGSEGSGTGLDYATVKYGSGGTEDWVARYDGPANGSDAAYAMVMDGAGNVYVTGASAGSGTGSDYATLKYMADSDFDGFSDAREMYLGTDPSDNCGPNAWPLDMDGNTILNISGDIMQFIGKVGWVNTDPGWTAAHQRLDLDGDTAVSNYGDVYSMYLGTLGKTCNGGTPPPPPRPPWAPPVLMAIDPDTAGNSPMTVARTEACVRIDVDPGDFGDGMADHSIDVFVKGDTQAPTTYDAWFYYEPGLVDPVTWNATIKLPLASAFTNDIAAVSRFNAGAAYLSGGPGFPGDGTVVRVDLDFIGAGLASFDFAFARNAYWSVAGVHDLTTLSGSLALGINTDCNTDRALELLGALVTGDDWDDSVDDDDDNDGFDDVIEVYLGTEPLDNCPNWPPGPGGDAWPIDMNMDSQINLGGDVVEYVGKMGGDVSVDPSLKRVDLNMDGQINLGGDVVKYVGKMGSSCT